MRLRLYAFALALSAALSGCSAVTGSGSGGEQAHSATLVAMDTVMELTAYGPEGEDAVDNAQALIEELDGLLSTTGEGGEIYAANHGEAVTVSEETEELLTDVLALCSDTGGALDVTIYPVVQAWGFTTGEYQVPDEETISALLSRVDYTQVQVENGVLDLPDGVELDLGAAAKGYAGDRVMELFRDSGVTSGMASLGGNVQVLGAKPDGSPWRVAVRDPAGDGYAAILEVTDQAVVTSGGYERYFEQDGVRYWHILDPATGYPASSGVLSVTIVSRSGLLADCLSTALFVMGKERACDYWRTRDDFDFLILGEDGSVTLSEGLTDCFSLTENWEGRGIEVVRR